MGAIAPAGVDRGWRTDRVAIGRALDPVAGIAPAFQIVLVVVHPRVTSATFSGWTSRYAPGLQHVLVQDPGQGTWLETARPRVPGPCPGSVIDRPLYPGIAPEPATDPASVIDLALVTDLELVTDPALAIDLALVTDRALVIDPASAIDPALGIDRASAIDLALGIDRAVGTTSTLAMSTSATT